MRALWMEYPNDDQAVALGDEYLWGNEMLIAPVVEKAATTRHLYLPAGQWYDWWTNKKLPDNGWIDQDASNGALVTCPLSPCQGKLINACVSSALLRASVAIRCPGLTP